MTLPGTFGVHAAAALAEIAGCFTVWAWKRLGGSTLCLLPGLASLAAFAWFLTLAPSDVAGRAYAVNGSVYIAALLLWLLCQARGGRGSRTVRRRDVVFRGHPQCEGALQPRQFRPAACGGLRSAPVRRHDGHAPAPPFHRSAVDELKLRLQPAVVGPATRHLHRPAHQGSWGDGGRRDHLPKSPEGQGAAIGCISGDQRRVDGTDGGSRDPIVGCPALDNASTAPL